MSNLFFAVAAFDRLHVLLYPMHRQLVSSEPRTGQESNKSFLHQKSNNYNLPIILISNECFQTRNRTSQSAKARWKCIKYCLKRPFQNLRSTGLKYKQLVKREVWITGTKDLDRNSCSFSIFSWKLKHLFFNQAYKGRHP